MKFRVNWLAVPAAAFTLLFLSTCLFACPYCGKSKAYLETLPTQLLAGRGNHHFKVSTNSSEAQAWFDQGLTMCYAFNHDEAIRSFRKALTLDSNLAMAHWGIAYALGTNYNRPIDSLQARGAYEAIQCALNLMEHSSVKEQDFIKAMARRYTEKYDPDYTKNESAFRDAMRLLAQEYPDDMDALTIFGESMMNLKPWQLWTDAGDPAEGTPEILATLEKVLAINPNHPGANHYYIHAVEASREPGRALACAERLRTLVTGAGHLVHMPAHTFMRVGDYNGAVLANAQAVSVDSAYVAAGGAGFYTQFYYPHNVHFLAVSLAFDGRFREAMAATQKLESLIYPFATVDPMAVGILPTRYFILLKFRKWDEILASDMPDSGQALVAAIKHFAWGMAHAAKGGVSAAKAELEKMKAAETRIPEIAYIGAINDARKGTIIARHMLESKIADAAGNRKEAIAKLRLAVEAQDALSYDEPEGWYVNARESLGAMLIETGQAGEAEAVFRDELKVHPNSGRALFGLWQALQQQRKKSEAAEAEKAYEAAWQRADSQLSLAEM